MHLLRGEAEALAGALVDSVAADATSVVLFPSFPLLPAVAAALAGSVVQLGGQDLHPADQGAHTGDVSGAQLLDAGCRWVLVGHSERRRDHGESDDLVARKAAAARRAGLAPMVCLGETESERRLGDTEAVLGRQLDAIAQGLAGLDPADFALAYEPVWAIGTGVTATPALAQEAHRFLRQRLGARLGKDVAEGVRLLYGGSVKPENAEELAVEADVDGFLVGGASLDAEQFLAIIARSARLGASAPRRRHP
jgi:triosephosphate isomerase